MNFRHLTLTLGALAASVAYAASEKAPDILFPDYEDARVIKGLSNNGKYGVASMVPGSVGFSYTVGSVVYDLSGDFPVATNIGEGYSASGACDITDDGRTVVGTVEQLPAVCRFEDGKWTWETMPLPDKSIEILMEDMYTGEQYVSVFKMNGGEINAVTPDGKYGVGIVRCNENELLEMGVMWDLENKTIVDVPVPAAGRYGEDEHQTRFMQLSDDGRYILCWNSFSYAGSIVYVFDRQTNEAIYIDCEKKGDGFVPRLEGYESIGMDGAAKSLSSDGHYVAGGIMHGDQCLVFLFDVWEKKLTVYNDGIHDDATGWSVTGDGMVLAGTPADTPYADALICHNDFLFPFESLYRDVYGMNLSGYGIDNTGKPFLVSDDGLTVVFVVSTSETYVARFKEPLAEGLERVNLMDNWGVIPAQGTRMTAFSNVTVTFDNPIETSGNISDIVLLDTNGNKVASPLPQGGVTVANAQLNLSFSPVMLAEGETYTLRIPEGFCWVKGHRNSVNREIEVRYVGRGDHPVKVKNISPASGASLPSLDLNDNPVVVSFDAPVKINGTADNRPVAHLYIDSENEAAAALALDVDLTSNNLVVYPNTTYFLYKGSEYRIEVPAGAVTDISGYGASEAFSVSYRGSYVPQMGDEVYLFSSDCDDFSNFLFYDGDKGTPTSEYAEMGFTSDTTPWWVVMDDESSTDMAFASHSSYVDGRQSDDWVMTRQINMPDDVDAYLSFQSQSYRKNKTDVLKIYVYQNDASFNYLSSSTVADIRANGELVYNQVQSPGDSESKMEGEWKDNIVDLSKYRGKNIYLAFLNDNRNQSMVMIDNIRVIKNLNAFITLTGSTSVVSRENTVIKGILTVRNELADYTTLKMSLIDGDGNEVSSIETPVSLSGGDTYSFEFPDPLPLTVGVENPFTIVYTLDDDAISFRGVIRNLSFQPEKRVVIEEFTGRDCKYCPLGIAAMQRLESLYGERVIPVVLHSYNGTDPKGANIMDYASLVFMNDGTAPNGRINRRPGLAAPMYSDDSGKYHMTAADVPGSKNVWQDEVVDEFNTPAILDVNASPAYEPTGLRFNVTVTSALNISDQNVRVLGILLEDGLFDRQSNGLYTMNDPLLGEFGQGGAYGMSSFFFEFNNVARGYWGQSVNGTPGLIPATLESGKDYTFDILYYIPSIVDAKNYENLKMVVMLIDGNTGRVINACVSKADVSSVEEIAEEMGETLSISGSGGEILVEGEGETSVAVYGADGRLLRHADGRDTLRIRLDGYRGMVIVHAVNGKRAASKKFVM